jgi:hypothetical protein
VWLEETANYLMSLYIACSSVFDLEIQLLLSDTLQNAQGADKIVGEQTFEPLPLGASSPLLQSN